MRLGFLPALLLAISFPILSRAAKDAPTVAIVPSPDTAALSALLTDELSKRPEVRLLEREALAKIGDERTLRKMAGEDAASLGRLLGAEGLLLLDKDAQGLRCRFTAVGLGQALFDGQIEPGADPASLAKILAGRIAGYAPKLRLDPGSTVALSILNLRADIATKESTALERQLTLLLEMQLAASKGFVVLERRHAWPLGLERSLSPDLPALRQGSWVVDGALDFSQGGGNIRVKLRLRKPGTDPVEIIVKGRKNDPQHLAEKLTAAVRSATGSEARVETWNPNEEAREYLREGLWAWQGKANDAALESLDSAALLGEKTADLFPLRIDVLRRRVEARLELAKRDLSSAMDDAMIDDTLRAIADVTHYEKEKLESQIDLLTFNRHPIVRTQQINETLTNLTSELLEWLDSRDSPRANELRKALRAITGYAPLEGKLGLADFSDPLNVLIDSRGQWDLTLDEQLAYYRLLGTRRHQYLPSELLTRQGEGFCRRFLKTLAEQKAAFQEYLRDLKADPNGKLAYSLIQACSEDPDHADAGYAAFWREMWNRREALASQKVQVQEWTSARPISEARRRKIAKQMIPLLRYYLTHVNNWRYWEYSLETMWQPSEWSEAEAAEIWSDYLGYRQRAAGDRRARGRRLPDFTNFEKTFEARFPALVAQTDKEEKARFLPVSRHWTPWQVEGTPDAPMDVVSSAVSGDVLWMICSFTGSREDRQRLFRINLSTLVADQISLPGSDYYSDISLSEEALYLEFQRNNSTGQKRGIARLDLATHAWETRVPELPWRKCFPVAGSLYLVLDGGLGRYDWEQGSSSLLASNRRRPAQNQFDDCDRYRVEGVYTGPGGRPFMVADKGAFFIREDPGEWPPVYKPMYSMRGVSGDGMTLNYAGHGAAVLLDQAGDGPEYLMAPPVRPNLRQPLAKPTAPWAEQTRWDPIPGIALDGMVVANRQNLFLLVGSSHDRSPREILRYGAQRDPQRVLFRFDLDAKLAGRIDGYLSKSIGPVKSSGHQWITDFHLANQTLCLVSRNLGAWFIPLSDLDAWVKENPSLASMDADQPQAMRIPPPEDDAESRVIGDMIDPAEAANSFR